MRGRRKQHTKLKLDRSRVLSFYLNATQVKLYEQDIYKYLIHLLKIFPTDEFRIIQFLLLQFHPLIICTCRKFHGKKIMLDWTDLISFARYCFVELVYRFNLDSTLYFKTFIPLALDRAINDYLLYDLRRKNLFNPIRLDQLTLWEKDSLLKEYVQVANLDNKETEDPTDLQSCKDECIHFIERHTEISLEDKAIFLDHFLYKRDLSAIAQEKKLSLVIVKKRIAVVLEEVKGHLKENFL